MFDDKSILVTGAAGSFDLKFIAPLMPPTSCRRIVVFSHNELKRSEMQQQKHYEAILGRVAKVKIRRGTRLPCQLIPGHQEAP